MDLNDQLDLFFSLFKSERHTYFPDGYILITIEVLESLRLLQTLNKPTISSLFPDCTYPTWSKVGHVIEDDQKITVYTDRYAIWIHSEALQLYGKEETATIIYMAAREEKKDGIIECVPQIAYLLRGIYNQPYYILNVIEHSLYDIEETEESLDFSIFSEE